MLVCLMFLRTQYDYTLIFTQCGAVASICLLLDCQKVKSLKTIAIRTTRPPNEADSLPFRNPHRLMTVFKTETSILFSVLNYIHV